VIIASVFLKLLGRFIKILILGIALKKGAGRPVGPRRDKKPDSIILMKVLGHSQVETTMRYLHADFGRMKAAMAALERKAKKKD
jgi:integrase